MCTIFYTYVRYYVYSWLYAVVTRRRVSHRRAYRASGYTYTHSHTRSRAQLHTHSASVRARTLVYVMHKCYLKFNNPPPETPCLTIWFFSPHVENQCSPDDDEFTPCGARHSLAVNIVVGVLSRARWWIDVPSTLFCSKCLILKFTIWNYHVSPSVSTRARIFNPSCALTRLKACRGPSISPRYCGPKL